jgi:REP element-mobilizing transposase RayT
MISFRRRHLPHYDSDHATYFVTACLAGSVPASGRLRSGGQQSFEESDDWLDMRSPVRLLADRRLARIVCEEIRRENHVRYELHAYAVMASHIHLVFTPLAQWTRPAIMQSIKGRSARRCNAVLGRCGGFWQSESYDRVVRDSEEFERFVNYVEFNPVKAGLCLLPEEWEFSSARSRTGFSLSKDK